MSRLYVRLFLWFCAANLLTILITAFLVNSLSEHSFSEIQPDWDLMAKVTVQDYVEGGDEGIRRRSERLAHVGILIFVFDDVTQRASSPLPPPIADHLQELLVPEATLHPAPDLSLIGRQVDTGEGPPLHFLAMRRPPPVGRQPRFTILVQLLVAALVIAAVGWLISRSISRPIAAVQRAARRVAEGDLSARVGLSPRRWHDEVGQLARDFDGMAERIQISVEQTRGLLQDISHELRSPLARLQLSVELAKEAPADTSRRRHLEQAQREVGRLDRVIGDVLTLARLEGHIPGGGLERVELDKLAADRVDDASDKAVSRDVTLSLTAETLSIIGDRALLGRAVDNLIDNAIKFSPPGAEVEVKVRGTGEHVEIAVLDRGPGIPEEDLAQIFRPFFRGSNSAFAEGQGLGLAIVRRIAGTHGGEIIASARAGGGTCLVLRLPISGKSRVA